MFTAQHLCNVKISLNVNVLLKIVPHYIPLYHFREAWGRQRSELWKKVMRTASPKSKLRKPLFKMSCAGSHNSIPANPDCYNVPSQVARISGPGSSCLAVSLKRQASEDLCETEDCACSSESEDDEENRLMRSPVIQVP